MAAGASSTPPGGRATGSASEWPANQKYISLYICSADDEGYIAERYKKALPKASIGRSCVRFKRLADLDQAALKKMILEGAQALAKV